jgi:gamma-butyrobetaine dioxygenase
MKILEISVPSDCTAMASPTLEAVHSGGPRTLRLAFAGQAPADFNLFWLRDNCPSAFHPQTRERTFDLLSLPDDLSVAAAAVVQGNLELHWRHDGHVSQFPAAWLWAHRSGVRRTDPAACAPALWRAADLRDGPARFRARDLLDGDAALRGWMQHTKRFGFSLVEGIGADPEGGMAVARRVGFLRESNFGTTFEVVNQPDPNNLAYTAVELPLHTDLPNQELPPGFQFLHCIANEATGGGSVFADGFALAAALRAQDAEAFATLCTLAVPFRFFDREADIRTRRPLITLDREGGVQEIAYNAHIADLLDLPADQTDRWYRAYRTLMRMTREPAFRVAFKLSAGEMVVFDNRRVLHGREAFNPSSGFRHLRGCYVDRGEWDSRLRLLG